MVKVTCIEGPHGTGKTKTLNQCEDLIEIIKEGDITKTGTILSPQGCTSQNIWIINWFKIMEKACNKYYDKITQKYKKEGRLYFDRSPYSAVFYGELSEKEKDALEIIISKCIKEYEKVGLEFTFILFYDESEEQTWKKVQKRIESEKWRSKLKESNRSHLIRVRKEYLKRKYLWNICYYSKYLKNLKNYIKSLE